MAAPAVARSVRSYHTIAPAKMRVVRACVCGRVYSLSDAIVGVACVRVCVCLCAHGQPPAQLPSICTEATQKLPSICPEATQKLPRSCPASAQKLRTGGGGLRRADNASSGRRVAQRAPRIPRIVGVVGQVRRPKSTGMVPLLCVHVCVSVV
jgi:hypothetical protein